MSAIAVVGANGWVGRALCAALAKDRDHAVTAVTRGDYERAREKSYDCVINSAMPSARFWAKNNPAEDFTETVAKTAGLLYGWKFKKFVQISTVSARCQPDTVYGRHKAAAESLCAGGDGLILRLGPMYGPGMKKGVLVDMLEGKKVFIDGESRYGFAPLEFVSGWIAANLHRSGIAEVGAKNGIRLKDVANHLGVAIQFEGPVDHQEIQNPGPDYPDARLVLAFLDAAKKQMKS